MAPLPICRLKRLPLLLFPRFLSLSSHLFSLTVFNMGALLRLIVFAMSGTTWATSDFAIEGKASRLAKKGVMRQVCFNYVNQFIRCCWVGGLVISLWNLGPYMCMHLWTYLVATICMNLVFFQNYWGDLHMMTNFRLQICLSCEHNRLWFRYRGSQTMVCHDLTVPDLLCLNTNRLII